jgi:hypothetical protein
MVHPPQSATCPQGASGWIGEAINVISAPIPTGHPPQFDGTSAPIHPCPQGANGWIGEVINVISAPIRWYIRPNSPLPAGAGGWIGEIINVISAPIPTGHPPQFDGTSALIQPLARSRGRAAGLGKSSTSYPPQFQRDIRPNSMVHPPQSATFPQGASGWIGEVVNVISAPIRPCPLWTSGWIGAVINGTSAPILSGHPPQFRRDIRPNSGCESLYNRIALRLNIR